MNQRKLLDLLSRLTWREVCEEEFRPKDEVFFRITSAVIPAAIELDVSELVMVNDYPASGWFGHLLAVLPGTNEGIIASFLRHERVVVLYGVQVTPGSELLKDKENVGGVTTPVMFQAPQFHKLACGALKRLREKKGAAKEK